MANTRQKLVASKLIENGGNMTKAMKAAGYSNAYARNSHKLTTTDTWKELMEKHFPDALLAKKLQEGLEANKIISARVILKKGAPSSQKNGELPLADSRTDDYVEVEDMPTRHKYLETALKLKNRLTPTEDPESPFKININIDVGVVLAKVYGEPKKTTAPRAKSPRKVLDNSKG